MLNEKKIWKIVYDVFGLANCFSAFKSMFIRGLLQLLIYTMFDGKHLSMLVFISSGFSPFISSFLILTIYNSSIILN
jgi:hypothetical protein